MTTDPREQFGVEVELDVVGPYGLVPSRHASTETGGQLDFGISARTKNNRSVVIGELFARAPGGDTEGIRLNTKHIGERITATLNACEGLNPEGYRGVVEALERIRNSMPVMPHPAISPTAYDMLQCVRKISQDALALARKES